MLAVSHITWPLSQFTKGREKEIFFSFKSQHKAFFELKHHLFFALVLTLAALQKPFEIETDPFDYVNSVFLTQ